MKELPKGWIESQLGELTTITSGFGFPKELQGRTEGDIPFAKVRDLSRAYLHTQKRLSEADNYVEIEDLDRLKARPVRRGATAFAKIGEALRLNRRVFLDADVILDNNCMACSPNLSAIDPAFLFRQLETVDLAQFANATTVPSVRKSDVERISFSLPPLAEQKRIVAKLDALSARSARARKDLARIDSLVTRYKQAVLSKAFSEVSSNAISIRELMDFVTSGSRGWAKYYSDEGPLFLRIGNTQRGNIELNLDEVQNVSPPEGSEGRRTKVHAGDVLITITADLGRVAVTPDGFPEAYVNQHIALLRLQSPEMARYVAWYMVSPQGQDSLHQNDRGATRAGLGLDDIRDLALPLPSLEVQKETVHRIENAFRKVDKLTAEAKRALELTDKLDEAILAKAFRGELVPQDTNDEPASVLLERIKAERAAAPKAKRGRKKAGN
jgi:type I restriction enzyme S subunit